MYARHLFKAIRSLLVSRGVRFVSIATEPNPSTNIPAKKNIYISADSATTRKNHQQQETYDWRHSIPRSDPHEVTEEFASSIQALTNLMREKERQRLEANAKVISQPELLCRSD